MPNQANVEVGRGRPNAPITPRTILIVDDEPSVTRALARIVMKAGFDVRTGGTVESGLAALREPLRGAIVDVGLPDGLGLELVRIARATRPRLPVLVVTGRFLSRQDIRDAQLCGVEFLAKPIDAANIRAFLGRCDYAPTWDELVDRCVTQNDLTGGHRRFLIAARITTEQSVLADELGVALNTIKTWASEIRERTGFASIEGLIASLRRLTP
jgi:DNA-binding response OmpR family regulator